MNRSTLSLYADAVEAVCRLDEYTRARAADAYKDVSSEEKLDAWRDWSALSRVTGKALKNLTNL